MIFERKLEKFEFYFIPSDIYFFVKLGYIPDENIIIKKNRFIEQIFEILTEKNIFYDTLHYDIFDYLSEPYDSNSNYVHIKTLLSLTNNLFINKEPAYKYIMSISNRDNAKFLATELAQSNNYIPENPDVFINRFSSFKKLVDFSNDIDYNIGIVERLKSVYSEWFELRYELLFGSSRIPLE